MVGLTLSILNFKLVHRCCQLFQLCFEVSPRLGLLLHLSQESSLCFLVFVLVSFDFLLEVSDAVRDYLVLLLNLTVFEVQV